MEKSVENQNATGNKRQMKGKYYLFPPMICLLSPVKKGSENQEVSYNLIFGEF